MFAPTPPAPWRLVVTNQHHPLRIRRGQTDILFARDLKLSRAYIAQILQFHCIFRAMAETWKLSAGDVSRLLDRPDVREALVRKLGEYV